MKYTNDYEEFAGQLSADPAGKELVDRARSGDEQALGEFVERMKSEFKPQSSTPSLADTVIVDDQFNVDSLVTHGVDLEGVGEDFVSKFPEKYANFGNQIGFGGKWTKRETVGAWGPASAWNAGSTGLMSDYYQGGERLNNYDFIKHIQTLPRGNPERIEMEKIISGAIKEREEMEKTLGDKAIQEPGAGKVGTEVMAGIEERSQERWRWLPQDTEQMDSRGMKGYLKVVRDNDPILTKRLSGLSDDVIMEEISKSIQEDQVMQKRMQEQLSAGRFVFEDPELYNWANRRGMVGESNVDIVGEVAKMLGSTIKGVGGMIKDSPKFFSGDQEAIDITNAGAELLIEDWDMLTDGAMRLKEKLDEKDWEDASYNPEQQKAAFDEAIEAKRQFLIRGLYNQNRWMNVSGQIAAEYATEQQAIFDKLMAFSVVFDPSNFVPIGKPASASAKAVTKGLLKGQMRKFAKLEGDVLAAQLAHGKALRFADMHKGASKGQQRVVQDRVKQTAKDLDKANSKLQNFNFDPEKAYKKMAGKLEKPQHGLRGLAMEGTGKAASKVGKVIQGTGELMGRHAKVGGGIGLLSGFASTDGDIRGAIVGAVAGHQAFRHKGIFLNKIGKKFVTAGNDISTIGKAYQLGQTNLPMHQLLLKGYDGVGHVSKATKAALSMYDPIYRSVIGRSLIEAPAKMITTPLSRGGATSAAFQAGIGYVGSGGEVEGALTGAGIGLGFASVSGGMSGFLGPWGEVIFGRNKDAVLSGQARLIETIYEGQQKDGWQPSRAVTPDGDKTIMEGEEINFGEWFGSLNNTEKKIVANQLLVHPDMDIRVFKDTRPEQIGNPGSYDPETKTTFLNLANPGWKADRGEVPPAMVEFVIGHESGHFVGNHEGMDSTIIQKLLGRPAQGIAPESPWIKRDDNGDPIIRDLQGEIVTREEAMQMDADGNPRTDVAYELSDEGKKRISQYVDRMSLNWLIQTVRSPRLKRKLRHPSFLRALKDGDEKALQSLMESAYNDPALQEYMAREVFAEQFVEYLKGNKMRTAGHDFLPTLFARVLAGFGDGFFNSRGEIQSSIFKGMKKWTGAQKLIKDYNRDVGSGKGREIEEPNRSQNFTQEEMNNTPEVVSLFDASSSVNWVESQPGVWTPEKDAKGNVKIRKPKEQKAYTQKLRETIMDWFSKNPRSGADPAEVQWRRNNDGKTVLAGRYLPDDLIKHLEDSGNFNPRQIEYIKSVNEVMKDPDNNDPILTFYQAATGRSSSGGRTYKSLAGTWRTVIPHGWEISKQDNLLLKVIEPEKLLANATKVAKSSAFKNVYNGDYQNVAVDMLKWLNNAAAGRRGAEGIGEAKRNLFRVASGMGRVMTERMDSDGNMVPVEFNELVDTLEEVSKRQGSYLMSFRTDRMNQVMPAAQNYKYRLEKAHNFDAYDRVKRNYYPGVDTPTPDGGIVRKFSDGTEITQGMHYFPGTVYHGTGHTVDEFSTRRIGDGEGVQAFGWGLYFTQNINIGKDYANRLSIRQRTWKGEEIPGTIYRGDPTPAVNNLVDDATQFILENFPWYKDGDNLHPLINSSLFSPIEIYGSNEWEKLVNKAKSEFQQYKNDLEKWKAGEIKKRPYQDLVDEVTLLTDHLSANYRVERKASLYEVKIHPEEETFLNWDKTFSEQSQFVQDTLTELAGDDLNQIRYLNGDPKNSELTGMGIYSQLKQQAKQTAGPFTALRDLGVSKSAMETSIKLEEYGIKGVMYLDGVSRKKGEGNHNLVVFNDRDIEIISRDERSGTNVRFHPGVDDARYMELVKDPNSDKTELRTLVEAAAKQAGYDTSRIVYRGDEMPFNELIAGEESGNLGRGLYFTPDRSYARRYGNPREFYLRGKIADIQSPEILPRYESILKELEEFGEDPDLVFSELAEELGVDGFSAKGVGGFSFGAEEIVVPEGSFAKSADLEVRDDSGNIIPLSERFNLQSDDIRYSPGVGERIPELEDAAKKLQSGSLSKEEYSDLVDKYKPVRPYTSVPQPATMEEMRWALNSNQLKKLGKGSEISEGQDVGLRLDINAYTRKGVWIPTIHHKSGKAIAHESVAMLTDGVFPDSGEKSLRVAVGANKSPFAVIKGKWKPITPDQAESIAQTALSDNSWTQVGFDPTRHSYFYDRKDHRSQVVSADEVIQIGPLVLAKNAQTKALTNQSSDIRFSPGSSQNTVDGNYQRLVESINAYTNPNLARRGIKGRKGSLGDELRAQAKGRTSEVQRDYTKQAAKRSGLTIPYQDLVQRVNRSGLEAYLKSPSVRAGDITRLRQLLGVNDGFYLDSSTISDSLLNAANPDGDLYFLGSGIESLAFRDISDGKVLKLRQTKTGDTHKFGLDVDVGSNGQVRIIMGDDFGAVQTINDFSGAFDTRYELEGFTDGMEYMLLKQDFIKPARDTKTSDIANYMLDNGWVIKVAPTTENIGGHQDVNQYFWFNRDKQLVATDAHVGNFHVDQNNNVFPIDLPTRKLTTQETAKVDMYYHPGVDEDGIVSQENMPGYNSGILRGLHSAAPSEKMAFHKALQKALHYKKGDQLINIIAEEMGVDASEMATGISAYLNSKAFLEMNPATQVTGFPSLEMAELYALLHGYFTYQEAVSGYKPEYGLTPGGDWGDPSILTDFILRDKNGNPVKATAAQVKKIHKIIEANTSHMPPGEFGDPQAGDIAYFLTDKGFRLMFLDLPSNPDMNLQIFANIAVDIKKALKINEDDIEETTTNSIYQENKWGLPSSGSGEAYRTLISDKASKAGQPDLLGRLERRLGPILQPVYDKFAKKGLGNPGTQPGVVREVAGVTLPRTMSQLSDADALTIANKVAPVKRGEDPYSAIEAREIVEDYMAWDKLSATEGDQFMGELKRVAGVNQKQLMDAKRKGKESVGQLKEKQVPAKAEMEGIPRKNQSVVFKNNDKVHFGIPKVSDVKYTIKWDKNKGKDGAFVVGSSHMAKSDVFPNIVLDGELGKAIEKPDHHASVFEATKKLNELVSGDPEKATSKQGYLEFMKKVGASSNALVVPSTLEVALNNPKLMADMILGDRLHGKRKIETRQNALDGLDGTLEFREAIGEGQAPDNRVTALLHLWGILSRMLPPLDQEGLWLRMMANRDVLEAVHKSTEGSFNLSEAKWKKIVAESRDMTDKNAAKIGNNATSNANSFHAALKLLNGKWDELGRSFATNDHSQMRQQYWDVVAKRGSLGIKNKVLSFMGLTTGIPTWVGDRWQYVFANLPTLERMTGKESSSMFTYDRYNTPEDPTGIYSIYGTLESDNPVFSNLLYEYINTSLQNAFEANPKEYKEMLGDHVNASGFHWVTWNAIKNEPVGHSSLSILLKLQKESGNIKTLDDFINLVMNEKTYTEGRKSGKNFRLIFDKGTITHDSTIVKD